MNDKTLGAYQRHEKHDAADFSRAEFARHPDPGRSNAVRIASTDEWRFSNGIEVDAEHLAERGWSPVRECPDPEQHSDGLPDAVDALTEALKNVHKRAEKAEKERDEARADCNDALRREKAEQDRADRAKRERDAAVDSALFAAVSRPLTPDAITNEMVERFRDHMWDVHDMDIDDGDSADALRAALTAPPARPEGAEEIERLLMDADRDGGEVYRTDGYTRLADYLAEGLSKGGVRVVGEDGAA